MDSVEYMGHCRCGPVLRRLVVVTQPTRAGGVRIVTQLVTKGCTCVTK